MFWLEQATQTPSLSDISHSLVSSSSGCRNMATKMTMQPQQQSVALAHSKDALKSRYQHLVNPKNVSDTLAAHLSGCPSDQIVRLI